MAVPILSTDDLAEQRKRTVAAALPYEIPIDLATVARLAQFEGMVQNLVATGYSVQTNALPLLLSQMLCDEMQEMAPTDFHKAGIGKNPKNKMNSLVRTDEISWIEGTNKSGAAWLAWIASLQIHLNEQLFLGLASFESHFARYRQGDFYGKHRDAFLGDNNRKLSLIIYLNKNWSVKDGGELVIYTNETPAAEIRIAPEFGTVVAFLSEDVAHEVLTTNCDRHSIAGWFRTNGT